MTLSQDVYSVGENHPREDTEHVKPQGRNTLDCMIGREKGALYQHRLG